MANINWTEVKMYYVKNASVSVADVAKKFKLSLSTVTWHSKREKWTDAREEYYQKFSEKLSEKMLQEDVDLAAERLKKVNEIADKLLDKLSQAVDELGKTRTKTVIKTVKPTKNGGTRTTTKEKFVTIDTIIDTLSAQQISTATKTLRDIFASGEDPDEESFDGIIEIGARHEEAEDDMDTTSQTT